MRYIYTTLILLSFFTLSIEAKDGYYNPYKKSRKTIEHKKKDLSKKKQKKAKNHKKRLSFNLEKIYKMVLKRCDINRKALRKALAFYKKNRVKKGLSSRYIAIADYTKTARKKRLYIINLKNGTVYRHKIAHGKYSGAIGGKVIHSSNRRNTHMTPYGFFKVGSKIGKTKKKKYQYLSVKGLEWSNRKVGLPPRMGGRDIVLHPAKYVNYGGRSHGCFSICPQDKRAIFAKLKKALLYSYTGR
jgi:hypothetical protein